MSPGAARPFARDRHPAMKWNKSTRFALYAALEMARQSPGLVTIPAVSAKYGISAHHLAKVMPQLVRAGIAEAVRGVGGGYRLARSAKDIVLLDIVEVFEGPVTLERCLLDNASKPCGRVEICRLKQVFDEIEQAAYYTLKTIRLATLLGPGVPS